MPRGTSATLKEKKLPPLKRGDIVLIRH